VTIDFAKRALTIRQRRLDSINKQIEQRVTALASKMDVKRKLAEVDYFRTREQRLALVGAEMLEADPELEKLFRKKRVLSLVTDDVLSMHLDRRHPPTGALTDD
jgi:hypothetical protein